MSFFKTIKSSLGIDIERPKYELVATLAENMEIRRYGPTKWVCTSVSSVSAKSSQDYNSSMFGKLFNYISGSNNANQKIAMTSPVTFDYQTGEADKIAADSSVRVAMRFFVPTEFQANTPAPTAEGTYIQEDPAATYAVVRFGGYASANDYMKYRDLLIERLGADAAQYDCANMMAAGYDPPFKPVGRTNEVWLRKKD